MEKTKVENSILAMGDVDTVIVMMDRSFVGRGEPEPEHMERAFYILKGLFERRYADLKRAYFGGELNA